MGRLNAIHRKENKMPDNNQKPETTAEQDGQVDAIINLLTSIRKQLSIVIFALGVIVAYCLKVILWR